MRAKTFTSDAWYASKANLNWIKNAQIGFLVGVAKNRLVRVEGGSYQQIHTLTIPEQELRVELKGVGGVKVFCQRFKNESCRYYLLYAPNTEVLEAAGKEEFEPLHALHWGIECFHRASKQLCGLQRFRVRLSEAIHTHVFCSLRAFVELELQVWRQQLDNWYGLQRNLYQEVARQFILQEAFVGEQTHTIFPPICQCVSPEALQHGRNRFLKLSDRRSHHSRLLIPNQSLQALLFLDGRSHLMSL